MTAPLFLADTAAIPLHSCRKSLPGQVVLPIVLYLRYEKTAIASSARFLPIVSISSEVFG